MELIFSTFGPKLSIMIIGVLRETKARERRVALSPEVVRDLVKKGYKVQVEGGAGLGASFSDHAYLTAGAEVVHSTTGILTSAQVIVSVNPPSESYIAQIPKGGVLISFMWAATNRSLVDACVNAGISAFSMDAIPRISRAQKMDALSSQANLAGYKSVLMTANALGKILPMMTTAAGTIKPAKVVIFGAGVAGLQAIATAKRLGAVVEVSDIRPDTKEQVESLGGKFIEVPLDNTIAVEGGYVRSVSAEFLQKQQETVARHVKDADIIITTALIPGKKAPLLVTAEMVKSMKPGSVILDMAVEQGGNVVGSVLNETIQQDGITIIGESNIPSLLPTNASELYARNMATLLYHLTTPEGFKWELEEEITAGSLIIYKGDPVHASAKFQNIKA